MKLIALFVSALLVVRLASADPANTNAAPASSAPPATTEDWTVGGKTFHNVTVTKVEADVVHILYDGGAGSVPLASLTPDLQKKFGYNPTAAAEAAQAETKKEAASDAMVQAVNAQKAKQAQAQASAAPPTFQDRVAASRNTRRLSLENEIKMRTDTLENLEAAAQAGGDAAEQKSLAYNIASQKVQIAKLQAELAAIP